ncbi:GlsB/YeaQ/YmgE family stress response membrane protein [Longivirga aurantiaca]|uniref:GlsB/YeaQ/YmgE family stress response membrane protein n=1 Tax=Longivirga aurantiaca TaxID=1837743 RepID=A0ABW1T1Z0_9ACTN
MEPSGIISGIFVGLIIGGLARLVIRNNEPTGCLLTMLIGLVGAAIGAAIGNSQGWGFWAVLVLQVFIAAVIVALFTFLARPKS